MPMQKLFSSLLLSWISESCLQRFLLQICTVSSLNYFCLEFQTFSSFVIDFSRRGNMSQYVFEVRLVWVHCPFFYFFIHKKWIIWYMCNKCRNLYDTSFVWREIITEKIACLKLLSAKRFLFAPTELGDSFSRYLLTSRLPRCFSKQKKR